MGFKGQLQKLMYSRWEPRAEYRDGYTLLMPMPEDMPFLLRLAMEGLRQVDTTGCGQIVVIGDGRGKGVSGLAEVLKEYDDPRIELASFSRRDRWVVNRMASPHWLTVIYGVNRARHKYAFLHDS